MKLFLIIFIAQGLVQATLPKAVEDVSSSEEEREMRKNPTPSQKILLYIYDNILSMTKHYAEGAAKVSQHVLTDELIVSNNKTEIMEFKKNLNMYVEKYETIKKPKELWHVMDIYSATIQNYTHIPDDKDTPESKIIIEILEKYNDKDVTMKLATEARIFMDGFNKMFEENKEHMNKAILDWYEKMKNIEDYKNKAYAFLGILNIE